MASTSKAVLEMITARVKQLHENAKGFEDTFKHIKVLGASPGKIDCEVEVLQKHTNPLNTMHGGFTSTLIDSVTTYALLTMDPPVPGVSMNLNVNFLKAATVGEKLRIEAEVVKRGRSVAFTTAKILNQSGDLIALGNHVKHLGGK